MILWLDAQLFPHSARWVTSEFGIEAKPVRELGLREARDREIFLAARDAGAVVRQRQQFVFLLEQLGPPPRILRLTMVFAQVLVRL